MDRDTADYLLDDADIVAYYSHHGLLSNTPIETAYKKLLRQAGLVLFDPLGLSSEHLPYAQKVNDSDLIVATELCGYISRGMIRDFQYSFRMKKKFWLVQINPIFQSVQSGQSGMNSDNTENILLAHGIDCLTVVFNFEVEDLQIVNEEDPTFRYARLDIGQCECMRLSDAIQVFKKETGR